MNTTHQVEATPSTINSLTAKALPLATINQSWCSLFRIAGVAAVLTAVIIPIQLIVFIVWPPPLGGPVSEWFRLFNTNWLQGLISLDILMVADYILLIPIVLALFVILRTISTVAVSLGAALFAIAIATYFSSNTSLEMLALSGQYAEADTAAEKAMYVAAGQAMLTMYNGTAFHVSYILGSVAGILIGVAMLRNPHFSRWTAYLAIVGNTLAMGLYLSEIGLTLSVLSVPILWIWYLLIARSFFRFTKY